MIINGKVKEPTFEEVYPTAEFSELIRLALVLTAAGLRLWARLKLRFAPPSAGDCGDDLVPLSAKPSSDPTIT